MNRLRDLMIDQLKELHNAEIQFKILVEKMAYQTSNEKLRHSFEQLSKDSEAQYVKLERIFSLIGVGKDKERHAHIMEAIGKEVQDFIESNPEAEVRDAGFMAIVQKALHYEIALYGTLRDYANQIENVEAERLLGEILQEEKDNDREITEKARSGINQRAADPNSISERFASTGR